MNATLKRLTLYLVYGCILSMQVTVGFAQDAFDLDLSEDRISLNAENAELSHILQELATQIGFKLWISDLLQARQVSLKIEDLSIEETLRRLLADDSYALVLDNNALVSALYVLPPGQAQSSNWEIAPDDGDIRQRVMHDLLNSDSLPDNLKATMLNQFNSDRNAEVQPQAVQPAEAISNVIKVLEQIGASSPETIKQLREKLELEKAQKQE